MKHLVQLTVVLFAVALLAQCSKDDDVTPINEPEMKDPIQIGGVPSQSFSVKGDTTNVTEDGYDVSGSLFVETDSAEYAIIKDADFMVSQDGNGNIEAIEGSGVFQMPDVGMFKKFAFEKAVDVAFVYNTGKFFKDNNDKFEPLPLRDTSYYFFFNILNIANGNDETLSVKNAELGVTNYFLNLPQQELIIPTGTFAINTPAGKISVGNDLAIGMSVKKAFPFTPTTYPDSALNAIIDQQKAFQNMTGFLYLAGEMSLGDEVPLKLNGSAVIDGDLDEVFTNGFGASSSFSLAMNGNLVFGHDLLDLLPFDFDAELTRTTLRYDQTSGSSGGDTSLKFAGDFDDNKWMETMLDAIAGRNVSQYVPFTGNEGNMFFSLGDDWEFYANTYFAINTPHLGKQKAREGTLHITSEQLEVSGSLAIPFMPGEVAASGTFGYDGSVHLTAKANGDLEMESLKLKSNLDIDINNDRATLTGDVFFPYGLATIDVDGIIDSEGLTFSGSAGSRSVKFGNVETPLGTIAVDVNIRKENPYLKVKGNMELPQMEQPIAEVSGSIDSRGLELTGMLNTALRASGTIPRLPLINVSLTARTWQGIYFDGSIVIPHGIAKASAKGQMAKNKDGAGLPEIWLDLSFDSNPTFQIGHIGLPTSDLKMHVSTAAGISFDGKVKADHFDQYMECSGTINSRDLHISAYYDGGLTLGKGVLLHANLSTNFNSGLSTHIADLNGSVKTPFGKVDVNGAVNANGEIGLVGDMNGCANIPLFPFSAEYVNSFTFSSISGVGVSATGNLCENSCSKKKNCKSVKFGVELDWAHSSLKLCVPLPFFGNKCVSL